LSALLPDAVRGVEVWAFPVIPGPDGTVLLGLGADEASETLGLDLLDALEALVRAPGATMAR